MADNNILLSNQGLQNARSAYETSLQQKVNTQKQLESQLVEIEAYVQKVQKIYGNMYKSIGNLHKELLTKEVEEELAAIQNKLEQRLSKTKDAKKREAMESTLASIYNEELDLIKRNADFKKLSLLEYQKTLGLSQLVKLVQERLTNANEELEKNEAERRAALSLANGDANKIRAINSTYDKKADEIKEGLESFMSSTGFNMFDKLVAKGSNLISNPIAGKLLELGDKLNSKLTEGIEKTASTYSQYMGKIDARLLEYDNTGKKFSGIAESINDAIGTSPYILLEELIKQVAALTEQGINYNLEERAYLATLSEKMVSTFNVLDSTVTRLTRLYLADITTSQMGSEALLTQFLNATYKDTSYLTGIYDNVSNAIVDAMGQFSATDSTAYAFNVQKWLGSLYSAGMSENAITMLAQGLNLLTTGKVSELSNSSYNTLFGLAASRAGMSYSSILTEGLNAEGVNKLMQSIVELLTDISDNTSNQVTKATWGEILNVSLSDIRAATTVYSDMSAISQYNATYESAIQEVENLLSYVADRTHISERIDNAINNMMFSWGSDLAMDLDKYASWKVTQKVLDITSSIANTVGSIFPAASAITTLISGMASVGSLIDTIAMMGIGNLFDSFDGILHLRTSDEGLQGFAWDQYLARGDITLGLIGYGGEGAYTGTSYSAVASRSSADSKLASMASQAEKVTYTSRTSNPDTTIIKDASDIYAELFEQQTAPIRIKVSNFEDAAIEVLVKELKMRQILDDLGNVKDVISDGSVNVSMDSDSMAMLTTIRSLF